MLSLVVPAESGVVVSLVEARLREKIAADPAHAAQQMVQLLFASEREQDSIRRLQTQLRQAQLSATVGLEWVTAMVDVARDLGLVVDGAAAPALAAQMRARIRSLQERVAEAEHAAACAEAAE